MWSNSALLLSPLWPLYLLTSDPVPWLCPVAGLTLALQPAVSPGLSAAGEKPSEKRFIPPQKSHQHIFSWFQTCCCTAPLIHCTAEDGVINLNDIAKRSCSISQMFFFCRHYPGEGLDKVTSRRGRIGNTNKQTHVAFQWRLTGCH